MNPDPKSLYRERQTGFTSDLATARKASARISNARLAVVLIALAAFFWFIFDDALIPSLASAFSGMAAFILLMIRHDKVLARERLSAQLLGLNEAGLQRMEGGWNRFPVDGRGLAEESHPFASDLDIFGPGSLFQWLNAAQTKLGRLRLRDLLSRPPRPVLEIVRDQGMVRELASRLDWRQRFQAAGGFPPAPQPVEDPDALLAWAESAGEILPRPGPAAFLRFLPAFAIGLAAWMFLRSGLTSMLLLPFLAQAAIASAYQRRYGRILDGLTRRKENLETYLGLVSLIEEAGFRNPDLAAAAEGLRNTSGGRASEAVKRLQRIADHLETRLNPILNFLVNALLLWDLQWVLAFRSWRDGNGGSLRGWLETIARVEALSSLATAAFENPDWAYPGFSGGEPLVDAAGMAHPLIPSGVRVSNDLSLGRPGEILIITGSNMSGKSTLMRTVGINLVLAYAGAPVCARSFRCGTAEVHTSMRLRDDLEKRISSFYAELLRLKGIVEAARSGKRVLFLVDEIFRGTNSKDRHEGAMAVLRQLHALGAAGLVSTHDLDLAKLEALDPGSFRNVHFRERYADGKISFDYRMHPGASQTTNAIHLIRMVGLSGG